MEEKNSAKAKHQEQAPTASTNSKHAEHSRNSRMEKRKVVEEKKCESKVYVQLIL